MAYSQYLTRKDNTDITGEGFAEAVTVLSALYENRHIFIGYKRDNLIPNTKDNMELENPVFSHREISFNGVGEQSYDDYVVRKEDLGLNVCKTNRRDYDFWVIVSNALLKTFLPFDYEFKSDASFYELSETLIELRQALFILEIEIPNSEYLEDVHKLTEDIGYHIPRCVLI